MPNKHTFKYNLRNYDILLVILLFTITIIGIFAIGSAKESVQSRQIAGFIVGAILMLIISFIDYKFIIKFQWPIYIINMILLLLVQIMGTSSNNAQRWVEIMGIRFQPSETAKILLILFYAQFIMKHEEKFNVLSNLLKYVVLILPPWILIYKQPDLSTSIVLILVFCALMYTGGLSKKIIIGLLAIIVPVFLIGLFLVVQPESTILEEYQQERILAWIYPQKYRLTTAYQQNNSIIAIGSGQLWGKGLNNDDVDSVKNGNYISEPQTDFIFAIIGEEMGFVGCLSIIILELLIAIECFNVGRFAKDMAGRVICAGMGSLVMFQSFINISVATGIMPNTGLPLPFVSYGLTSLVSLFIGMGFVLNVGLQRVYPKGLY